MDILNSASKYIDKYSHNLSINEQGSGWSHICGGVDGRPFQFASRHYTLVGVKGRYASYINGLQFLFYDTKEEKFVESPPFGQITGERFELVCEKEDWISRVSIWSSSYINAIQFETSKGKKSPVFGGNEGSLHVVQARHKRICGVKGLSSQMINQLCFAVSV